MKRLLWVLLFLVFVQDAGAAYTAHLGAPLGWVFDYLLAPTPILVRPFDVLVLGALILARMKKDKGGAYVPPMRNAVSLMLVTTAVWFLYGVLHGGEARFASWQTYLIFSTGLLSFALATVFTSVDDFHRLAKWLIAASVYHAVMCWISYFTWARSMVGESGAYLTTHDDTICWVVSILVLIVNAVDRRSPGVILRNALLILFFLGAIQWNSRRLAWVSLAMGLVVTYVLFPQGAAKRRFNRIALYAVPVLLAYVLVGWGRQNPIFLPLRSLSTVSTQEDGSTLARNAENLGLIATASYEHLAFGTGWGRPYVYLTMKYDISGFELWRYFPHNSILGLFAFTGILGFAGFWLALPTAVFLDARVARLGPDSKAKNVAIIGAAQLVVCANQLYGDIGIFSFKTMYVIAVSYAMAMRLPLTTGVWGPAKTPAKAEADLLQSARVAS